jgi:hypothetical protein
MAIDDMVGLWKFDEGGGDTAFDSSGNGHHGAITNAQHEAGGFDGGGFAMRFGGQISNRVNVGTFDIDGPGLTLACWLQASNLDTPGDDPRMISKATGGAADAHIFLLSSGRVGTTKVIRFRLRTDNGQATTTLMGSTATDTLAVDEWIHAAVTWDGSTMQIYKNGQAGASVARSGDAVYHDSSVGVTLGNQPVGAEDRPFEGLLDEALIVARALTAEEIQEVMLGIDVSPELAGAPSPEDGAVDVTPVAQLSWQPGQYAQEHDVYLGSSYDAVNEATTADAAYRGRQGANQFDPGRLALDQTHYWRIDEVNGAPDKTVFKGKIWSFTVEPVSYALPMGAVTATASSMQHPQEPVNTVNGTGLNENDQHGTNQEDMWVSDAADASPWIQFDFESLQKLDKVHIWNHNTQTEGVLGFGIKEALIETSVDGETWSELGTVELVQALGTANDTGMDVDLQGTVAQHVRITGLSNWSLLGLPQRGLSEVRFYAIPVLAREPEPADGSTSKDVEVALQWRTGREAVEHEVVFSDDEQAVIEGSAVVATVSERSYDLGTLDLGMTYFWKINEMNDLGTPPVYEGDLWTFQTPDRRMIDDFEMYQAKEGLRIWEYWIDGFDDPGANGAVVGNGDDAEKSVVYEGGQSMPITFNNTTAPASEVTRYFDTPVDLTIGNPESLKLQVRGDAPGFVANADGTMTVGAAGVDIWGTADDCRFVYKRLSGDGSITAKVNSAIDVHEWTKAGVMIRENLSEEATNAYSFTTPRGRVGTQWRDATFGATVSTRSQNNGTIALPHWVRITRTGSTFKGEQSADGVTWLPMVQEDNPANPTEREIAMIPDVYIGLAVTSHVTGTSTVAVFSEVTTTGNVTGSWNSEPIGADEHPNNEAAPMYLVLADTAGKEVTIDHPDPAATVLTDWDEWTIPLGDLSPVNVTRIDSITVGVGSSGVQGKVYIDAIRTDRAYAVPDF